MSFQVVILSLLASCLVNAQTEIQDVDQDKKAATYNLQSDIKELVAKYLVEMTQYVDDDADAAAEGRYADSGPIPFGKHKHNSLLERDRYAQLLQKLQEQELQLQQLKQTGTPQQTVNQQGKQESLIPTPAPAPIIAASTAAAFPVQKVQEDSTTIPIILTTPSTPSTISAQAIPAAVPVTSAPAIVVTSTQVPASTRPTVDPVHHINQVNKILGNVANGNIVGIVDESLAIRAPQPVRNLVTNIMKVIFCNPIDRLFGRCAPNQVDAGNNSVKGK